MYNKGSSAIVIIIFIFAVFFIVIFLGLSLFAFSTVSDILDQNVTIGNTNLQEINQQTFGKMTNEMLNAGDNIGLGMIIGMILFMIVNAYFFGDNNKIWIPVDMVILIAVYIIAVYISNTYETLINASTLLDVYVNELDKTSRFLLNLPKIVGTIGALLMILTYAGIGRSRTRQGVNVFEA